MMRHTAKINNKFLFLFSLNLFLYFTPTPNFLKNKKLYYLQYIPP